MPISGARRRKSSPFCRVRFFQLKRTRESCPSPRLWLRALVLCGQLHRPNVFQDAPKIRLRREAHGSISVQEGQPVITYLILHILLSFQEAYFVANWRGFPVSFSMRFVAETVARAISAATVMKISPAPFRG